MKAWCAKFFGLMSLGLAVALIAMLANGSPGVYLAGLGMVCCAALALSFLVDALDEQAGQGRGW